MKSFNCCSVRNRVRFFYEIQTGDFVIHSMKLKFCQFQKFKKSFQNKTLIIFLYYFIMMRKELDKRWLEIM